MCTLSQSVSLCHLICIADTTGSRLKKERTRRLWLLIGSGHGKGYLTLDSYIGQFVISSCSHLRSSRLENINLFTYHHATHTHQPFISVPLLQNFSWWLLERSDGSLCLMRWLLAWSSHISDWIAARPYHLPGSKLAVTSKRSNREPWSATYWPEFNLVLF